jgi:hypothetical protein
MPIPFDAARLHMLPFAATCPCRMQAGCQLHLNGLEGMYNQIAALLHLAENGE